MIERDAGGLLEPLSGQQGAPIGYLWLLRGIVSLGGEDESWLRLPSLVAGIALLPLVWVLGRRLLGRRAASVAVALVAVSPGLIRYSVELKQYALDATVAVALVLLAVEVDEKPTVARHASLGAAGVVAVWLSHPAVLVLAGVGLLLLVRSIRRGITRETAVLAVTGLAWLGSLGVLYLVSLRELTGNDFLTDYWSAGFPDSPRPDRFLGWVWSSTVDLLDGIGGIDVPALAAAAIVLALAVGARRGQAHRLLPLVAFLPGLVVAAALHQYPYRGRLAVFALPFLLLALSSAVGIHGRVLTVVAGVLVAVVAAGPVLQSAEEVVDPLLFPESRPVIGYVADHVRPGDRILLHGLADAPFSVYGPRHGIAADGRLAWRPPEACDGSPALATETGTVWVVFAYTHSASPPEEAEILRTHLAASGHLVDLVERHDAFAARYEMGAAADDPTGEHVRVTPTTGCLRVLGP